MQVLVVAEVSAQLEESVRGAAQVRQRLIADDAPDGLNFWFVRTQYRGGDGAFESPRHHHAFQQIRWSEAGRLNYAPRKYISEGEVAYFPRGAYYGPQHRDTGISFACQYGFGAEHQRGKNWEPIRAQALERLSARGSFKDGVYSGTDPETGKKSNRDAVQAVYEESFELKTGRKFVIPKEGYREPVLIHPQSFAYFETAPGIETRQLGGFYEHPGPNADTRLKMVRLHSGAGYTFESDRAQHAWVTSAGLQVDGRTYPEGTCLYSPRGETLEVSAERLLEMHVVEFPRLD